MLSALRSFIIYRISAINNDTRDDEDGEFLIIFACGKERITASSERHPNFDLNSSFRIDNTRSVRFIPPSDQATKRPSDQATRRTDTVRQPHRR
jgi:hypothetical protein